MSQASKPHSVPNVYGAANSTNEEPAQNHQSRRDYLSPGWRLFYAFVGACLIFDVMALKVILHG